MNYLLLSLFAALVLAYHSSASSESQEASPSEWFLCSANSENEACRLRRSQPQVTPLQPLESPTEALEFSSPAPKKKRKPCSKRTCFHGECVENKCVCEKGWKGAYCKRDIDECRSKPCGQICVNTDGGYACTCCENYYLDVDLSTCVKESTVDSKISMTDQPKVCQKGIRRKGPKKGKKKNGKPSFDRRGGGKNRPSFDRPAGLKASGPVTSKHRRRTTMRMSKSRRVLLSLLRDVKGITTGATSATKRILFLLKALRSSNGPTPASLRKLPNPCIDAKCRFGCMVTPYKRARCFCPRGYRSDFNKRKCIDINECDLPQKRCPGLQTCHNEIGSYECKCIMGYKKSEGKGHSACEDIDECETGENLCDSVSQCINEPGYYRCICPQGYAGDGVNCTGSSSLQPARPLSPSLDLETELVQTEVLESNPGQKQPRIYTVVNADGLPAERPSYVTKRFGRRRPVSRSRWQQLRGRAEWQKRMKHMRRPM